MRRVTCAVRVRVDHGDMNDITEKLEPSMLLHCSRCGRWHEVRPDEDATGFAVGMLYWRCGGAKYFAGYAGTTPRRPVKRRLLAIDPDRLPDVR